MECITDNYYTYIHQKYIERKMKITLNEKEYELKYSFRAFMIYENIMGKSFNPSGLTDMIIFFYSAILGVAKDDNISYEDFLDWLDANPKELTNFSEWLMKNLGVSEFVAPEVKQTKKANKKAEKSKN